MTSPYIVCPKCGRVSHNSNDVRERYCGACHAFHDDLLREATMRRIRTDPAAVIIQFSRIARPVMRRFMRADACIAAARTTIEVMKVYGLEAVPLPVSFLFQVPVREYARLSGFSAAENAEMKAKSKAWLDYSDGDTWNGHLIVLVANRWVLDPSIDQADAPEFGVHVPQEVFYFDLGGKVLGPDGFDIQLGLVLDTGDPATLFYRYIPDESYRESEAWNDEGLPLLAHAIAIDMELAWKEGAA